MADQPPCSPRCGYINCGNTTVRRKTKVVLVCMRDTEDQVGGLLRSRGRRAAPWEALSLRWEHYDLAKRRWKNSRLAS